MIIANNIITAATAAGQTVLVLAHTKDTIKQTSHKLFEGSIAHGIIQAEFMTRPDEAVQVASIRLCGHRAIRIYRMEVTVRRHPDHRRMPSLSGADLSRDH